MWRSRTDRDGVREEIDQFSVDLPRRRGVLVLGVVLRLLQSGSSFGGVVVEVPVVVPEKAVPRVVVVRVSGLASLFQTDFVSGGTM